MPFLKWEKGQRPTFVLKYYPLDWLSGTENISGMAMELRIKGSMKCEPVKYQGNEYLITVDVYQEVRCSQNEIVIRFKSFCLYNDQNKRSPEEKKYLDSYKKEVFFNIHFKDLLSMLSEEETTIFMKIFVSSAASEYLILKYNENYGTCVAYNGVLSGTSNLMSSALMSTDSDYMNVIILLSGVNCPGVNLARNVITSLPLETFCNLVRIREILNEGKCFREYYSLNPGFLEDKSFTLTEAWQFWTILEKHPDWEDQLQIRTDFLSKESVSLSEVEKMLRKKEELIVDEVSRDSYNLLCLAALKRRFTVWIEFSNDWDVRMILKSGKSDLGEFPVILFFHLKEMNTVLGRIKVLGINYYNQEHRFSLWLIKNRKDLQDKVPGMYNNILTTMIFEAKISVIVKDLNDILDRLKQFPGNPFNISRELYLSESDFI